MTDRSTFVFPWGALKHDKNSRMLSNGDLLELVNFRLTDEDVLHKRRGYDMTAAPSFIGGTHSSPPLGMVPADVPMWRDSSEQIWARNGGTAYFRGRVPRAFPTWYGVDNRLGSGGARKPLMVHAGGNLFYFAMGANKYQLTIFDATTRATVLDTQVLNVTNIAAWAAAADLLGNVWLFYVASTARDTIQAVKFTGTSGASTTGTYVTAAGLQFTGLAAHFLGSTNELILAATTLKDDGAGNWVYGHYASRVNTGTLTPAAAVIVTSTIADTRVFCCSGPAVFGTGASNVCYLSYWRPGSAADDTAEIVLFGLNAATMAVNTTTVIDTEDVFSMPFPCLGQTGGHVDGGGNRVVYASVFGDLGGTENIQNVVTKRYTYNGVSTSEDYAFRSSYLAGAPVQIGTQWYVLTGFDDGPDARAQRGYFLRNSEGKIVTTILDGEGSAMCFASGDQNGLYSWDDMSSHTVTPVVVGGKILVPLLREQEDAGAPYPVVAEVSFSEAWRSTAKGIDPGGVPVYVTPQDVAREVAPIHSPYQPITFADGLGADHSFNRVAYRYATVAADGSLSPSGWSSTQSVDFHAGGTAPLFTLNVPTCRHVIGPPGTMVIQIAGSVGAALSADRGVDLYLQKTVSNDPSVDTVAVDVYPLDWDNLGELADNAPGVLRPSAVPPARLALEWRDRTWLMGTPDGEIWPSQEREHGRGPEFNPALAFAWRDGTGPETAWCPLSDDVLVVFRRDAVGLITGPGPDGVGAQGYRVTTLATGIGCTNPASVICAPVGNQGAVGVYFQNTEDGRIHVTTGGPPVSVAGGLTSSQWDYVPVGAVWNLYDRMVKWHCSNGSILALDYVHPPKSDPAQFAGQWLIHSGAGLPIPVDSRSIRGVETVLDSSARLWSPGNNFTDNGVAILKRLTTGRLGLAGFLNEFDLLELVLSSSYVDGSASTYSYVIVDQFGTTEVHGDPANTTHDVHLWSALDRIREFSLSIVETAATGRGRYFDGIAAVVGVYGRLIRARREIG